MNANSPFAQDGLRKKSVPKATFEFWESLRKSNRGDMQFICCDGERVIAHKDFLAVASPVLQQMLLDGRWKESEGEIVTQFSSEVINAVKSFVYTGEVSEDVLQKHAADLFVAASYYQVNDLTYMAQLSCINQLTDNNVKKMMCLAHRHIDDAKALKKACFKTVRRNLGKILTDPEFMNIFFEYPDLWTELQKKLSRQTKSDPFDDDNLMQEVNKRFRTRWTKLGASRSHSASGREDVKS